MARDGVPQTAGGSTSERLITTAAGLFWERGYAATGIRDIASALGIQTASLYHHIAKKEDLLYALCVDSLERITSAAEAAITGQDGAFLRLRALIGAHVGAMLADRAKHATMLVELRSLSEPRRAEVLALRDHYEDLVRGVIGDGQATGLIDARPSARHLSLALLNLMNWSIFWYRPGEELSPEQLGQLFADIFLDGVARGERERGVT
jgi:AcrR family transcriptional regulator